MVTKMSEEDISFETDRNKSPFTVKKLTKQQRSLELFCRHAKDFQPFDTLFSNNSNSDSSDIQIINLTDP